MHIEIPLTKSLKTIIDQDDLEIASRFKWYASKSKNNHFAASSVWIPDLKKRKCFLLHRVLLNAPPGMTVDHINGNPLDNRRINLRLATYKENSRNRKSSGSAGFLGVKKSRNGWMAMIFPDKVAISLGTYPTKELAAAAYNAAAEVVFGEFAKPNLVPAVDGILDEILLTKERAIERLNIELNYLKGLKNEQ